MPESLRDDLEIAWLEGYVRNVAEERDEKEPGALDTSSPSRGGPVRRREARQASVGVRRCRPDNRFSERSDPYTDVAQRKGNRDLGLA